MRKGIQEAGKNKEGYPKPVQNSRKGRGASHSRMEPKGARGARGIQIKKERARVLAQNSPNRGTVKQPRTRRDQMRGTVVSSKGAHK